MSNYEKSIAWMAFLAGVFCVVCIACTSKDWWSVVCASVGAASFTAMSVFIAIRREGKEE